MWERSHDQETTFLVDAAAFAAVVLPHLPISLPRIPPSAPPVTLSHIFDVQLSCRNEMVLSSGSRRSLLLRQCDWSFDKHRHPYVHDALFGIQLLGSTKEESYDGYVCLFYW